MKRLGGLLFLVFGAACFAPDLSVTPRGPLPHDDDSDPCRAARCDAPGRICVVDSAGLAVCVCGEGTRDEGGVCVDDPCSPNPCPLADGRSLCTPLGTSFSCACDDLYFDDDGAGGCVPRTAAVQLDELGAVTGGTLNGQASTFSGRLRVSDRDGRPVSGAAVSVLGQEQLTDLEGRVVVPSLPWASESVFTVRREGYHSTAGRLSYAAAGGGAELSIRLEPHDLVEEVLAERGGTLAHGGVAVTFPPRALQTSGATPGAGAVQVALSTTDEATLVAEAPLGLMADGSVTPLEALALAKVALSRGGEPVVLDPVLGASLSLLLSDDAGVAVGDRLALLRLDEERGVFVEESSCLVAEAPVTRKTPGHSLACSGLVRHFSTWAVARPTEATCVHLAPRLTLPAHLELLGLQLGVDRCLPSGDGLSCRPSSPAVAHEKLPSARAPLGALCAAHDVIDEQPLTPVLRGTLRDRRTGERFGFLEPLPPLSSSPQRELLSAELRALRYDDDPALCQDAARCTLIEETITIEHLPAFVDRDGDGHYVATGSVTSRLGDCDDEDRTTYPGAFDAPCDGRDTDCDGVTDPFEGLVTLAALDTDDVETLWADLCRAGCALPEPELGGNLIDEDCDGSALDRDGDGLYRYSDRAVLQEPWPTTWDCDDTVPNAAGAIEVPGNLVDEDCDGVALDADGDGYVHTNHLVAFLARADLSLALGDCDDLDDGVHPGVSAASEAALAAYYAARADGKVVRAATFCELLDDEGRLRATARAQLKDRNCDGELTDLDGDGFPGPGQTALGAGLAPDCDDLDPRVRPVATEVTVGLDVSAGPLGEPVTCDDTSCRYTQFTCGPLDESDGVDEGRCAVSSSVYGAADCGTTGGGFDDVCAAQRCPPLLGAPSQCIATANRADLGVCAVPGWEDRPPAQPFRFGAVWGPCDLSGVMPLCPAETLCGATISVYDENYLAALEALLADEGRAADLSGVPTDELGMCFPRCF